MPKMNRFRWNNNVSTKAERFILLENTFYIEHKEKPMKKKEDENVFIVDHIVQKKKFSLTKPPVTPIVTTTNFVQKGQSEKRNEIIYQTGITNNDVTQFSGFNFVSSFVDKKRKVTKEHT